MKKPRRPEPLNPYVLVIDDDEDSLTITRLMLEGGGIVVKTASNAADGLTAAITDPPAVAIIDVNMPIMSGIAVLRGLRADPRTEGIAAVALTGAPELVDAAKDIRFDWVLTKPASQDELVRIVQTLLKVAPR